MPKKKPADLLREEVQGMREEMRLLREERRENIRNFVPRRRS